MTIAIPSFYRKGLLYYFTECPQLSKFERAQIEDERSSLMDRAYNYLCAYTINGDTPDSRLFHSVFLGDYAGSLQEFLIYLNCSISFLKDSDQIERVNELIKMIEVHLKEYKETPPPEVEFKEYFIT